MNVWTMRPWGIMEDMRREMERMMRSGNGGFSSVSFLPGRAARAYPLVNLSEDRDRLYVEALAPGLDTEKLKVFVTGDQLEISGEKLGIGEVKPEAVHRSERAGGRFLRTLTLPAEVDDKNIEAQYRNGILEITLPKSEKARAKEISVKVA